MQRKHWSEQCATGHRLSQRRVGVPPPATGVVCGGLWAPTSPKAQCVLPCDLQPAGAPRLIAGYIVQLCPPILCFAGHTHNFSMLRCIQNRAAAGLSESRCAQAQQPRLFRRRWIARNDDLGLLCEL